ncbi:TetR/AcrR family transcriptional regulator [Jeotgalibacillus haloalkalitolerans]|uniref:TetR-like C-terminal domain-containing protein n=1 Tax=Jeotgalibacillus haloalkalitolerans TaxID=3104292 RepID=A0ABU5KNQ8_9BACL|nr:TetR-like C-terminal domain-containing protein [Jeotgalibacillus sp. HH7-29]MDZ5712810.1 TetR-like C-terminal domain-containing protein [Jeotgalibacillus sp. HH7-29]
MTEKLDHRKKYTRKVLKDSLIQLLGSKPISSVTVKEICAIANINRSTFYTHYQDHFDLLHKIEEEIVEDMRRYLQRYTTELDEEALKITEKILDYMIEHKDIIQALLSQNGSSAFEKKVMELTRLYMMNNLMNDNGIRQAESKYLSTFVVSGAIHVIKEWLANDLDQPSQELAVLINSFVNEGLSYLEK